MDWNAVISFGFVFLVFLLMFVVTTAAAVGIRGRTSSGWVRRSVVHPDADDPAPSGPRLFSAVFAGAYTAFTQFIIVVAIAQPSYGPVRFLLLGELVAAAAWVLYLARLVRRS